MSKLEHDLRNAMRDEAWKRIRAAARKFNGELNEEDRRDLPHGGRRKGAS